MIARHRLGCPSLAAAIVDVYCRYPAATDLDRLTASVVAVSRQAVHKRSAGDRA